MSHPRGLSEAEAAAWEQVAATVKRLEPLPLRARAAGRSETATPAKPLTMPPPAQPKKTRMVPARTPPAPSPPKPRPEGNLDSRWDRRLKAGSVSPDFTLDLHGHGLDAAYNRLMGGVAQARAVGARTILLIAGKSRPVDPADRGTKRGAIRAKVLDWLAASEHQSAIAAVRRAHIRHGGEGALYIVLRRER